MDLVKVLSSNIEAVGYDDGRNVLVIKFNSGSVYEYYDVPAEIYEELLSADSVGKFHNEHVKNEFSYKKVR